MRGLHGVPPGSASTRTATSARSTTRHDWPSSLSTPAAPPPADTEITHLAQVVQRRDVCGLIDSEEPLAVVTNTEFATGGGRSVGYDAVVVGSCGRGTPT
jgi:hypothetical protein